MEEDKKEGKKTFMERYAFLFIVAGVIAIFVIMKLIGFPDFLYK